MSNKNDREDNGGPKRVMTGPEAEWRTIAFWIGRFSGVGCGRIFPHDSNHTRVEHESRPNLIDWYILLR